MTQTMTIDGGCHCGAITYQAQIDPSRVTLCHCTDCQTLSGSAFRASVLTDPGKLQVHGTPAVYVKVAESGRRRLQHFCGHCGTSLFSSSEADAARPWGIRWGGIRQREQLTPTRQIWRRSAPAWVCAFDGLTTSQTE